MYATEGEALALCLAPSFAGPESDLLAFVASGLDGDAIINNTALTAATPVELVARSLVRTVVEEVRREASAPSKPCAAEAPPSRART